MTNNNLYENINFQKNNCNELRIDYHTFTRQKSFRYFPKAPGMLGNIHKHYTL